MAQSINEVTPLQRNNTTGLKDPCSYTTLSRTVYFDDGKTLKSEWDEKIAPASIPIILNTHGYGTNYDWNVIRYGFNYATANIHVAGITPSQIRAYDASDLPPVTGRIEVVVDRSFVEGCVLTYNINLPVIRTERIYYTFNSLAIPLVTVGNNSGFATGAYPFSTQAYIDNWPTPAGYNDRGVVVKITIAENALNLAETLVSDFNISVHGYLEPIDIS